MSDYVAEKLIRSLLQLVPLRARLWRELGEEDRTALTEAVESLARGTIDRCLAVAAEVDEKSRRRRRSSFVTAIQAAKSREDVLQAFAAVPETRPLWEAPYFEDGELEVLQGAVRGGES